MPAAAFAAVTLDAAGTLLHPEPDAAMVYAAALSRNGRRVTAAEVAPVFGRVWRELEGTLPAGTDRYRALPDGEWGWWSAFVRAVLARLDHDAPWRKVLDELWEHFADAAAWRVFPEVPAALAALRTAGLRLAVVSNWDSRLPGLLEGLGLAGAFDAVVVSALAGVEKPDPRIFTVALDRLGVAAPATLHAGDDIRDDYEGARAAGLAAVLVDREGRHRDPRRTVPDLAALVPLVTGETACCTR